MYGKILNCSMDEVCAAMWKSIHTYPSIAEKNLINISINTRARKEGISLRGFLCCF